MTVLSISESKAILALVFHLDELLAGDSLKAIHRLNRGPVRDVAAARAAPALMTAQQKLVRSMRKNV